MHGRESHVHHWQAMILILILRGGIGNQFFQYSALCYILSRLGSRRKGRVILDLQSFRHVSQSRSPQIRTLLKRLKVKEVHSQTNCSRIANLTYRIAETVRLEGFLRHNLLYHIIENEQDIKTLWSAKVKPLFALVGGYLQDNAYPRHLLAKRESRAHQLIEGVSMHLRLGDYLKKPYSLIYRVITPEFIKESIRIIRSESCARIESVQVFSENMEEAKDFIEKAGINNISFTFRASKSPVEDVMAVAELKYRILSCSTFSLLAHHIAGDGVSTIPSQWFKDRETPSELVTSEDEENRLVMVDI